MKKYYDRLHQIKVITGSLILDGIDLQGPNELIDALARVHFILGNVLPTLESSNETVEESKPEAIVPEDEGSEEDEDTVSEEEDVAEGTAQ